MQIKCRYIIPFTYGSPVQSKRDYILFLDRKTDPYQGTWKESTVRSGEQDLYEYVLNSFDDAGVFRPGNIGAKYDYIPEDGEESRVIELEYRPGKNDEGGVYRFSIDKAGMILFINGAGFIWYEFGMPEASDGQKLTEEEYIVFNNRFKELNYRENLERFAVSGGTGEFSMGNWVARVAGSACGNVKFFSARKNTVEGSGLPEYVPDKALIFNYGVFEDTDCDVPVKQAYYLTKGYNMNYRMPSDIDKRMRRPFENILWYAAAEGAGCYAKMDEKNRQFLSEQLEKRFMGDYFLIYILLLSVEFSLIQYSDQISTLLPADPFEYFSSDLFLNVSGGGSDDEFEMLELEKVIRRITTEINVFIVKNVRSSVSYIEHQNDFYSYVYDVLGIKQDINTLMMGLSSLQKILSNAVLMEKEANGEKVYAWRKEKDYKKIAEEKELLQKELFTDPMTGLYNRKGMTYYSKQMLSDAKQDKKALFVCMIDMNGLKYINDTYGHEHGDKALKELSRMILEIINDDEKAFRMGGDEFLILGIHDVGEEVIRSFNLRMEDAIKKCNDALQLPYKIDASFGPVLQPMESYNEGIDALITLSDSLMYEMKKKRDPHMR